MNPCTGSSKFLIQDTTHTQRSDDISMLIYHRGQPTPTCVSDDEHSTSQMSSSSNASIAASIVATAAERLGDFDPQELFQKLEAEKIREDWQLEYLDSQQWHMLGVPMGLVASIRRCIVERKHYEQDTTSPRRDFSARAKAIVPSQLNSQLNSLEDISHTSSPTRSTHSAQSVLSRPPVMPTRKESSRQDSFSKTDIWDMQTIQENSGCFPDSVPPALPQRVQSLEYSNLDY